MHMKYFNSIGYIEDHYQNILEYIKKPTFHGLLGSWDIDPLTMEKEIVEEYEVLRYLISLQFTFAHDKTTYKPTLEVVNRTFNRQLAFLEKHHKVHAYNVNKHPNKLVKKKYKACTHYLFKFSLPAWYQSLPDTVLTLEERNPEMFG